MAILHKNISAEGDIHNPKWFSGANNGDVAWRNELGVLESTDELVLPAALDFLDGSAAPPTSNSGDIYVLSSGASVNAGWGTVALGDWVRYDGTTWNDITPQKSTLCYNETLDKLFSYDGSLWTGLGGDSVYTASATAFINVEVTIDNTFSFLGGGLKAYGLGTAGTSVFSIWNGDGTPNKLWDFLDNGNVDLNQNTVLDLGANNITLKSSTFNHFNLYRSASGNGSGAAILLKLNNSLNQETTYNEIISIIDNNTANSENGAFWFRNSIDGNIRTTAKISKSLGFYIDGGYFSGDLFTVKKGSNSPIIVDSLSKTTVNSGGYNPFKIKRNVNGVGSGSGMEFENRNSSNADEIYASIIQVIKGNTAGSEDGSLQISVMDGGSLTKKIDVKNNTINFSGIPTSATGLVTGDLWNDGGTLKIA